MYLLSIGNEKSKFDAYFLFGPLLPQKLGVVTSLAKPARLLKGTLREHRFMHDFSVRRPLRPGVAKPV